MEYEPSLPYPDFGDTKAIEAFKVIEDCTRYIKLPWRIDQDLGNGSSLSYETINPLIDYYAPCVTFRMYANNHEVHVQRFLEAPKGIRYRYTKEYLQFLHYISTTLSDYKKQNEEDQLAPFREMPDPDS